MSEFRTIREVCSVVVDCPHSTPKWTTTGKIVIRNNNIKHGKIDLSSPSYTDEKHFEHRIKRAKPQPGDLIITREAPIGEVGMIPENTECCLGQRMVLLRADESVCDNFYLLYSLQSVYVQHQISWSEGTGTTVSNLRIPHLEQIRIPYLPLKQQKQISSILRVLEWKIENNRILNDNFQQQLRTIFKAEFTDNPELESMTQIPLSELCHVVTKGTTPTTLGKPFVESGINFIKAESILDDHSIDKSKFAFIDEETNALLKRSIIHAGDVVFTIAGTLGRFALIDENVLPANTNQAVAIIRADVEKVLPEYIYTCFIGEWHTDYYAKRVQQAVQANLSLTTIKSLPIPLLDEAKMSEYLSLILPLIKAIKTNEAQNEKLAALRDDLLPKLMSGEIDVSAIQL